MLTLLHSADWLFTLALAPFFAFLAMVTVAALARRRGAPMGSRPERAYRFLFVIPAHDEVANIAATVASCRAVAYDPAGSAVFVIADNCTDATAEIARAAGAEVFERHDLERKSKGYALEDFFRETTESGALADFDAAVLVDADTVVEPNILTVFAGALAGGADWVQCYYSVRNPDASWRTRLLTYAFSLFNGVWLLGQDGLGLSVGFRGNGMGLSTRGLARVPWTCHGLVEDQEFGWTLRIAGERVRFVPGTRVYAEMVSRGSGSVSQRQRWEEGRRLLRSQFVRPLLTSRAIGPGRKLLYLIDLEFPPLMPLMAGLLAVAAVHPAALLDGRLAPLSRLLLPWHALMALATLAYAASPFLALGLPLRYLKSLSSVPYYAVWKLSATFRSRTAGWVRTRREGA
jgi:cellulose synthase/poly-beta-1,6-N-acetylglucosamine synthase-like glycosyltransferase